MTAAIYASSSEVIESLNRDAAAAWDQLVDEVHRADGDRTVISSEFFCEADEKHVSGILQRLGDSTQVVITLRPLARILASQWQQFVQNQVSTSYPAWLGAVLHDFETSETPVFWRRHRHDLLVRRWAACAGPDRVTVVIVDERDPHALLTRFEELLAVSRGTLQPAQHGTNRSLRYAEVELLRRFNEQWALRGWSEVDYQRIVRFGAVRHLQSRRPREDEERILTPAWAVARAQEVSGAVVEAIEDTGVDVVGDPRSLTDGLPAVQIGENASADVVPLEVAARFAAGLCLWLAQLPKRSSPPDRPVGELEAAARDAYARLEEASPTAERRAPGSEGARE